MSREDLRNLELNNLKSKLEDTKERKADIADFILKNHFVSQN